jgi:hypothetical protein
MHIFHHPSRSAHCVHPAGRFGWMFLFLRMKSIGTDPAKWWFFRWLAAQLKLTLVNTAK